MAFSKKTSRIDRRGVNACIQYGKNVIDGLSEESVALLKKDPNLNDADTLLQLRERYTGKQMSRGVWMIDESNYDVTLVHISMCIDENRNQTLASLAFRIAYEKRVRYVEAAEILSALNAAGILYVYENRVKKKWTPGDDNSLIDAIMAYQKKNPPKRARKARITVFQQE